MKIKKIHKTTFFIGIIISTLLMTSLTGIVFSMFNEKPILTEIVKSYSPFQLFILGVLVAPLTETLIFQAGIIEFFLYHLKVKYTIIPIFFSGVVFGLMHFMNTYNIAYVFVATIMGFWFAFVYILTKKRGEGNLKPLIVTFISHLSVNLVAFLVEMSK